MDRDEKISIFDKLEFWIVTAGFVFCIPLFTYEDLGGYIASFVALLLINFRIAPALMRRERVGMNIFLLLAVLFCLGLVYFFTTYGPFMRIVIMWAISVLVIAGHLVMKRVALFIISRTDFLRSFFLIVTRDGMIAFGLWLIIAYWMLVISVPTEIRLSWFTFIPTAILLHGVAFHYFIPAALRWTFPLISYFFKVGLFCLVLGFGYSILLTIITEDDDNSFTMGAINGVINMIFTAPALWLIYRWKMKGNEQIVALQGELGRSVANLDFLRSQINPHFLFNALNTIYGLAIQEKAERTSVSVQKLGDMMRFMLLENMQNRILLKRELEYLDNYISLQRLRTDDSPSISIQVDIPQDIMSPVRITPMLLIPFVENAFKHGISLREQSYIRISLELKNSTLYFDVANSTHEKMDNDPEKDSNGIGLVNVRQRLQHMYKGRHELLIRETSRDFFVHLRIELD